MPIANIVIIFEHLRFWNIAIKSGWREYLLNWASKFIFLLTLNLKSLSAFYYKVRYGVECPMLHLALIQNVQDGFLPTVVFLIKNEVQEISDRMSQMKYICTWTAQQNWFIFAVLHLFTFRHFLIFIVYEDKWRLLHLTFI